MKNNKFQVYASAFILMVSASALLYFAGRSEIEWVIWLTLLGAVLANFVVLIAG